MGTWCRAHRVARSRELRVTGKRTTPGPQAPHSKVRRQLRRPLYLQAAAGCCLTPCACKCRVAAATFQCWVRPHRRGVSRWGGAVRHGRCPGGFGTPCASSASHTTAPFHVTMLMTRRPCVRLAGQPAELGCLVRPSRGEPGWQLPSFQRAQDGDDTWAGQRFVARQSLARH